MSLINVNIKIRVCQIIGPATAGLPDLFLWPCSTEIEATCLASSWPEFTANQLSAVKNMA